MGTPRDFDKILKQELNIHAAWMPVTNTFQLGDYGLISEGVLAKLGNIKKDFGVTFAPQPGPDAQLNFSSKGTSMVRVAGGAEVPQFPGSDVHAKLTVQFDREQSFFLKARLSVSQMDSPNHVAAKLNKIPEWEPRFRVVSALYTGTKCALFSSKAAGSKIELSGTANALQQLDLGAASAELQVTMRNEIGIEVLGKQGVVGLGMFKLGWWDPIRILGPEDEVPIETSANWPHALPDDL